MAERSELEINVRNLVAYDVISKPLSSLGNKVSRARTSLAKEISGLVREGEEFERVTAYIERKDEQKARTLREGIDAFKEEHPRYGKILEGLIKEKRLKNNRYLCYGINEGFKLGCEDYRRVMKSVGLEAEQADAMYPHLIELSDRLGEASEQAVRQILVK